MGKTSKVFDSLDKDTSVRDTFQKGVKKRKRKRDLDNLRQQVIESKHAMVSSLKNSTSYLDHMYLL